jgi:4-amino-4-deoxychorismate lyase
VAFDVLIDGAPDHGVSPRDRGLAYGDGVFRTLPVMSGQPASWSAHYAKLARDCAALGIACPDEVLLLGDIRTLFPDQAKGVAKIIVTRGAGGRGYAITPDTTPCRIVMRSDFPVYPDAHQRDGVTVHLCSLRLSVQPRLAGIKHLNRLENVLARAEWTGSDYAEGLLLDTQGNVIEGTMSNLFIRRGERLTTPDLSGCGVAGVARDRILAAGQRLGLRCEIGAFDLDALFSADEVVLCNSLIGAWQVRQLQDRIWAAQSLAARLRNLLSEDACA